MSPAEGHPGGEATPAAPNAAVDTGMRGISAEPILADGKDAEKPVGAEGKDLPAPTSGKDLEKQAVPLDADADTFVEDDAPTQPHEPPPAQKADAAVPAAPAGPPIPDPDVPYGWVIVAASFACHFAMFGTNWSYGVFQRYYTTHDVFSPVWPPPETPGGTASQTLCSLIGSLQNFSLFFFSPVTGRLADRWSYAGMMLVGSALMVAGLLGASFVTGALGQSAGLAGLALLQGVLYGTGMSCAFPPVVGAPGTWFRKRRGLAVGIAVAGTGLGGFAIGPLTQLMIDTIGWRWALRVLGIIPGTVVVLLSPVMRSRLKPQEPGGCWPFGFRFGKSKAGAEKKKDADRTFFHFDYFKDATFSLMFTGAFVWVMVMMNPWFFISPFAAGEGYTASQGALLVGILNGASAFGRIALGLCADYFGALNALLSSMFGGVLSCWILWPLSGVVAAPGSYGVMVAFAVAFGLSGGGFVSLIPTSIASIYGIEGLATRLGMFFWTYPFPALVSGPLGGVMIDSNTTVNPDGTKTSNFLPLIFYTSALLTVGVTFFVAVRIMRGRGKAWNSKM